MEKQNDDHQKLIDAVSQFVYDPLGFVYFCYPWGEPGTILENENGPDEWQKKVLIELGQETQKEAGDPEALPIQIAVKSGHGPGKTTLIAWIIQWFLSTRHEPEAVVTSNTKNQLETKTWRELAKWHNLMINGYWFEHTSTRFYMKGRKKTWFANAIPWSKERSDAFQGTHERHVLMIFDEASAIEDIIWDVTEGAMTTPGAIHVAFGNPTRNEGRFCQIFDKKGRGKRWITHTVDCRTAKKANQKKIKQWIDDYGIDSDFVRVRVLGIFPRASSMQLIPVDLVDAAIEKAFMWAGLNPGSIVLGVDVARYGDNETVILVRQGMEVLDIEAYMGKDTMQVADLTIKAMNKWQPDSVFVDVVGIGAGVADRLRQLKHQNIVEVNAGKRATDEEHYCNLRANMWVKMRDWFEASPSIPADEKLKQQLISVQYGYDSRDRYQIERKEDMISRGVESPDRADALALTFAYPVARAEDRRQQQTQAIIDYQMLAGEAKVRARGAEINIVESRLGNPQYQEIADLG